MYQTTDMLDEKLNELKKKLKKATIGHLTNLQCNVQKALSQEG